jgi:long-chain acyl-CoA synthetase
MENSIPQRLFSVVKKCPTQTALKYKRNNIWESISYKKLGDIVKKLSSALDKTLTKSGTPIAILSENRWEWLASDLAIVAAGHITVPLHTSNALIINNYILKNSQSKALFISDEQLLKINLNKLLNNTKINLVIVYGNSTKKKNDSKFKLLDFQKIINNKASGQISRKKISLKDTCCILYTSGTTGDPKGVVLSNQNLLANVDQINNIIPINSSDVFLSFLPYSHALEHTAGFLIPILNGSTIVLAESVDRLAANIQEIKPTIMIVVPRIFEKVYDKIMDKVRAESAIKQKIFYWAQKIDPQKASIKNKIADLLVFKKIKQSLGGRIRFFVSGGSALSKEIAEFFFQAGLLIVEGYGLTETSPIIAANRVKDFKLGTIGKPLPNTQIRLKKDGELLVKGPQVMSGYFLNSKKTEEAFENGWLKTGDLVEIDNQGFIKFKERKKEIIVLSTGKNVAPQFVENHLNLNKYIQQGMVYGDDKKVLEAFIIPDFEELKIWLKRKNQDANLSNKELVSKKEIISLYRRQIKKALRNLGKHEQIGNFKLLAQPFSQTENELTPTLKLKRKIILNKYQ